VRGGYHSIKREVTTTMKRGEVEAHSRGWRTPRACCPLSYIKVAMLLFSTHHEALSLSLPCCSTNKANAQRCAAIDSSPLILRSEGGEVLADSYFHCPTGTSAHGTSLSRTCDRIQKSCPLWRLASRSWDRCVIDYIFTNNVLCRNVIPTFNLWGWVTRCYHLLDMILVS
jgi:hypothetical protein